MPFEVPFMDQRGHLVRDRFPTRWRSSTAPRHRSLSAAKSDGAGAQIPQVCAAGFGQATNLNEGEPDPKLVRLAREMG
jgi:hypothetical protein